MLRPTLPLMNTNDQIVSYLAPKKCVEDCCRVKLNEQGFISHTLVWLASFDISYQSVWHTVIPIDHERLDGKAIKLNRLFHVDALRWRQAIRRGIGPMVDGDTAKLLAHEHSRLSTPARRGNVAGCGDSTW